MVSWLEGLLRGCPAGVRRGQRRWSRADRAARGKDARGVAPLESHAEFTPDGPRDPVGLLGQAKMIPPGMTVDAGLCGWTLARAHARSGDREALAADLGGSGAFDQAIGDFAETYADQDERDYAALQAAVKDGKVEATTEI